MNSTLSSWKEDIIETVSLVKMCLTSFWFWLPVLYASYLFIQIWAMMAIHPLTILVGPAIIALYAISQEERGMKARYNIKEEEPKGVLRPFSLMPEKGEGFRWDVEKSLEEYRKMMEEDEKK
jgi:hypothetical protein